MNIRKHNLNILIVEDEKICRMLVLSMLGKSSLAIKHITQVETLSGATETLRRIDCDVVLLDLNLPDSEGMDTLEQVRAAAPNTAIVVITGEYDEEVGLDAIAKGAQEYIVKGCFDINTLSKSVLYAIERLNTDRELQAANARYQSVFENSAVAIMVANEREQLVSWNEATAKLLKYKPSELYLRPVQELYPEREWRKIREEGIREKGVKHSIETRMICGDGRVVDVDLSLSILRDSNGTITGSIGIASDITERKQIQRILFRKQKNIEAIFDSVPIGMLLVDEHMTVKRANLAITRMVGRGFHEIINQKIGFALGCMNNNRSSHECGTGRACQTCPLHTTVQAVFSSDTPIYEVEAQLTLAGRSSREACWFSISADTVMLDDVKHIVVAIADITSRREAESRLQETMEMKSQFVSTVSHELRTPLGCMKEAVGLVLDGVAGNINPKQKGLLEITKRNIDRLALLINDVLDFQKLQAGQMELQIQEWDMRQFVEEVHQTMACAADKKSVKLRMNVEDNLEPGRFDRDRMIQVLTNLLSNAIKFTPGGGTVSTCVQKQADNLVIEVQDSGIGIPARDVPRIFDRFFQSRPAYQESKGTGLGLSIVQKIIQLHGGSIEVESEVDQGSTFRICLPLHGSLKFDEIDACNDVEMEVMVGQEQV